MNREPIDKKNLNGRSTNLIDLDSNYQKKNIVGTDETINNMALII